MGPSLDVMTVSVGVALVSTELSVAVVSYRRALDGIPRDAFFKVQAYHRAARLLSNGERRKRHENERGTHFGLGMERNS